MITSHLRPHSSAVIADVAPVYAGGAAEEVRSCIRVSNAALSLTLLGVSGLYHVLSATVY